MNKTGLVMKTEKNIASIMTSYGEFFKVEIASKVPKIGDEYTGKLKKKNSMIKNFITAACLLFMVLFAGGVYTYYAPTSSVVININPSIELKADRWNKIIKYSALNKDGKTILKGISIRNKSLNEGLNLIVEQSKKDNFINENYIKNDKIIKIQIFTKNNVYIDLSKFEEYIFKSNLNLEINNNNKKSYFNRKIDKGNLKGKNVESKINKRIENRSHDNKIKVDLNPNKKTDSSSIKRSDPKDLKIINMQNNYRKDKDNRVFVKDTKEEENEIRLEKNKYYEKR